MTKSVPSKGTRGNVDTWDALDTSDAWELLGDHKKAKVSRGAVWPWAEGLSLLGTRLVRTLSPKPKTLNPKP